MDNVIKRYLKSHPWPVWVVDCHKKVIFINDLYEKLYNLKYEDIKNKSIDEIFPQEIADTYIKHIESCMEKKKLVLVSDFTNKKYKQCNVFPIIDKEDKVLGVAGIIIDVTVEEKIKIDLRKKEDILRTIIDSLPDVIFFKDKYSKYIGCNKSFLEFYETFGINSVLGKTDLEIYPDKEVAKDFLKSDKEIMQQKESVATVDMHFDKLGNPIYEEITKVPVIGEDGEAWGIVGLSRDITAQKKLEERLRYLSYTDMLTGVYNRTFFEERIQELSKEKYFPLGIIMGDVNGLKLVNDSLGHLKGDEFLKSIADILTEVCMNRGDVFRWGGDEFIILLPNTDEQHCEKIVYEIRDKCKGIKYNGYFELSIALGETIMTSTQDEVYKLIKEVEERVYRQKLLEKNSVRSSMMLSLKEGLEAKNMETEEHTERVEIYASVIGKNLGLKTSQMDELLLAARLHDIGKIAIDEEILQKPGRLTKEEFEVMKTHAEKGYRIINAASELVNVAKCVLTHHERWDGGGYPLGIAGEEIPLLSRIISVADSFDVMTHERVYKKAMTKEEAVEELIRCSGTQFDPFIVKIFIDYLKDNEIINC